MSEGEAQPRRRQGDAAVDHLHDCVESLKGELADVKKKLDANQVTTDEVSAKLDTNNKTTEEVRDLLKSFKILGKVAKQTAKVVSAVAAAGLALQQLWSLVFSGGQPH